MQFRQKLCIIITILTIALVCSIGLFVISYLKHTSSNNTEPKTNTYFNSIDDWYEDGTHYKLMYANDTNVMYMILVTANNFAVVPLYNPDGSLQIWSNK